MSSQSTSVGLDLDQPGESLSALAEGIGRFVDAWENEPDPPGLSQFLPNPPSLREVMLVELIKVDLEYRWLHKGPPKRLQEYTHEFPELSRDDLPIELVYEEFHLRRQCGLEIEPQEYLEEFPQHADRLRKWLGIDDQYESTLLVRPAEQKQLDDIEPGITIDDFDLLLALGRGAFARVFLARQRSLQRLVALKISADRGREPQTLAQLDHDGIVRVFDQHVLPDRGLRLLYMQYVAGGTLQSFIERLREVDARLATGQWLLDTVDVILENKGEAKPTDSALRRRLSQLSWAEAVALVGSRLASGLDYAHRRGVLHRDIKPANILLNSEGAPKLVDFNISFSHQVDGTTPAAYFGGSLAYMSPEQLEACHPNHPRDAADLDGRSDLFSLGVVLWELLTGERPYSDGRLTGGWRASIDELLAQRQQGVDIQRLAAVLPGCPPSLTRILQRCLSPERTDRWESGAELARQLDLCLDQRARELIDPPADSWPVRLRRYAIPIMVAANLIPNGFAAIFNKLYNERTIVANLGEQAAAMFHRLVPWINGIAFPLGILLMSWYAVLVVRGVRRLEAGHALPASQTAALRQSCLRLGETHARICLVLWILAGFVWPVTMHLSTGTMNAELSLHWWGSLVICGLIAVAYPFFGVTSYCVRALYPPLLLHQGSPAEDARELRRLDNRLGVYLVVAGSVPLLAVGGLALASGGDSSGARAVIGVLCLGGIAGLAVVYLFYRRLQQDLAALLRVVAGSAPT